MATKQVCGACVIACRKPLLRNAVGPSAVTAVSIPFGLDLTTVARFIMLACQTGHRIVRAVWARKPL